MSLNPNAIKKKKKKKKKKNSVRFYVYHVSKIDYFRNLRRENNPKKFCREIFNFPRNFQFQIRFPPDSCFFFFFFFFFFFCCCCWVFFCVCVCVCVCCFFCVCVFFFFFFFFFFVFFFVQKSDSFTEQLPIQTSEAFERNSSVGGVHKLLRARMTKRTDSTDSNCLDRTAHTLDDFDTHFTYRSHRVKMHFRTCAQRRLGSACTSAQSDQPSLSEIP